MIKDNLKYILVTAAIIAGSIIIAERISVSTVYLAETIKSNNKIELSQESIKLFVQELRSPLMPPNDGKDRDFKQELELKQVPDVEAGRYIKGNEDAPVEIVEFSDFECPFSKRHNDETYKLIDENFIKTGKVKYSFRHLPLGFHANAKLAAAAVECAGQQNKFWDMKEQLFAQEAINEESINKIAKKLGLKKKAFNKCIKSDETQELIKEDLKVCEEKKINGTPATLVNGTLVAGAYPYELFEELINAELKRKQANEKQN